MHHPERIFQYQAWSDHALENIQKQQLWFSDPSTFNDPFDCAMVAAEFFIKSAFEKMDPSTSFDFLMRRRPMERELFEKAMNEHSGRLARVLGEGFRGVVTQLFERELSVCCFSSTEKNLLMWGHYSSKHEGFCLEFDTSDYPFHELMEVKYHPTFPEMRMDDLSNDSIKQFLKDLIIIKCQYWSYEQEWRLLRVNGRGAIACDDALKAIYFGVRMPNERRAQIAKLLKGRSIRYYTMSLSECAFEMVPSELSSAELSDLLSM